MADEIKKFLSGMLLITGIVFCAFSLVLVNYLVRATREVLAAGSEIQSGGSMLESAVLGASIALLFVIGSSLIILYVRNKIKSLRKN